MVSQNGARPDSTAGISCVAGGDILPACHTGRTQRGGVGGELVRAAEKWARSRGCVEMALRDVGLTPNQYFILLQVKTGEATSAAELSRAMGISQRLSQMKKLQ